MINIRSKVFETNSSSSHSISISKDSDGILETICPNCNGIIILVGGQFGWEWEKYNDALIKANYCALDNPNKRDVLIEVIKEHTGAKDVIMAIDEAWNGSYIDHQSCGTSGDVFESKETLKNFIFNPKSWLFTGNDNESPPSNFYDVEENIKYKYQLKLEGTKEVCNFKRKPTNKVIKETIYSIFARHPQSDSSFGYYPNKGYSIYSNNSYYNKMVEGDKIDSFVKMQDNIITVYRCDNVYDKKTGKYIGEEIKKQLQLKFEIVKLC